MAHQQSRAVQAEINLQDSGTNLFQHVKVGCDQICKCCLGFLTANTFQCMICGRKVSLGELPSEARQLSVRYLFPLSRSHDLNFEKSLEQEAKDHSEMTYWS